MNVRNDKSITVVINKTIRRNITINPETRLSDIQAILILPSTYRFSLTRNGTALAPSVLLFSRIHNHGRLYTRSDEQMVQLTLGLDVSNASKHTGDLQLETTGT